MTKLTKKSQRELFVLSGLFFVVAATWLYSNDSNHVSAHTPSSAATYKPMGVANPRIHWDRVESARNTEYQSTGRDIFNHELPPPPPPPVVHLPQPGDADFIAPPPPPPPPLVLPVKFLGYGSVTDDDQRQAILTDGDTVYTVSEGQTLLGRFRIVKIGNRTLEFEEVASGRHGTAQLEEPTPAI